MYKRLSLLLMLGCFYLNAAANHITGGEMYYYYNGIFNGEHQYSVTLKLFMRCNSGRTFNNPTVIGVFDKVGNNRVKDISVPLTRTQTIQLTDPDKCITNPPTVCYEVGYYEFVVTLPTSAAGYILSGQVVYRVANIGNLVAGYGNIGATYTAEIPGTSSLPTAPANKSANFVGSDLVVICAGNSFTYSFAAKDDDGDNLRYSFCEAYQGGGNAGPNNSNPPESPPYNSVPYSTVYNSSSPLGSGVQIDPQTGLITGRAPAVAGIYVVTVCVEEIRNGVVIAIQRKDIQINIAPCTIAGALLQSEYMLCQETTVINLENLSRSPLITSQYWELIGSGNNVLYTSTTPTVQYQFPDTGLYHIRLVINRNRDCTDSTEALARVYPGFKTDFSWSGVCFTKPTRFADLSTSVYGVVNSWSWDLGQYYAMGNNPVSSAVSFTYTEQGSKKVQLIVGNSKGCLDTLEKNVTIIDKPPLDLAFKDTLICVRDQVIFRALASGTYSWTPALNLVNPNSATPTATPDRTTTYYVELNDDGCINKDSVKVRVTDRVSLSVMADTTICQGDSIRLRASSDAFTYVWTPASQLTNQLLKEPVAFTKQTTRYQVNANIGGCTATDEVLVSTVPYPTAFAGRDTTICYQAAVILNGLSDGRSFAWSPSSSLSSYTSITTVARPAATTNYIFSAFDDKGCPKPGKDTILVTVLPKIHASGGKDTSVIVGQPLQLKATGGVKYSWTPTLNLSSGTVANPMGVFYQPSPGIKYKVLVYDEANCVDSANITVKVFKTGPDIFVPTAFSPDGNGKNDKLKPIAVGMKSFENFSIYNRWGQKVFQSQDGSGWDGSLAGKLQDPGVFTWMARATDYNGVIHVKKGTFLLVR